MRDYPSQKDQNFEIWVTLELDLKQPILTLFSDLKSTFKLLLLKLLEIISSVIPTIMNVNKNIP